MPVTPRLITAIVAGCIAVSAIFVGNLLFFAMIGEINRKTNERDAIKYLGYSLPKVVRVFRAYRTAYPDGRLHVYLLVAMTVQWISAIVVIVCLFTI